VADANVVSELVFNETTLNEFTLFVIVVVSDSDDPPPPPLPEFAVDCVVPSGNVMNPFRPNRRPCFNLKSDINQLPRPVRN